MSVWIVGLKLNRVDGTEFTYTIRDRSQRLPDFVSKVIRWQPIDTETLVVATDFSLTNDPRPPSDVVHIARMLAVGPLPAPLRGFLSNKRVTWAVHGGRNFDVVSKFGCVRQEGASVIRLENQLSKEKQENLRSAVRESADSIQNGYNMKCPNCEQEMDQGWLAMFNAILWLNFVVWQPKKPGYVRFVTPRGAERVIIPKLGGKGCPRAHICKTCKTVTFSYGDDKID